MKPDDKFRAHNAAVWEHGLLVHVPAGVELEKPLYLRVASSAPGGSLFWRVLVVADPGSRFTRGRRSSTSSDPELEAYANGVVEVVVHDGAKAEIVNVQRLSSKTWLFASCHARIERDAELDWVEGGFGSAKGKTWIQNDLADRGASSRVTGAYFADGSQHLDYDTYQLHAAPDTTSDFAFKGALRDSAATVWRGMIRVEEGAQKTNAYQENRNLLLSKTATANSIPGLEILANDVRCTHGATLSQVDREQLFYLMARGLPRSEAERLIVRGFFQDVLDRIELAAGPRGARRGPRGPHPAGLSRCLRRRPGRSCHHGGMPCSSCATDSLDIFGEKSARRELRRYLKNGLGGADAKQIAAWAEEGGLHDATVVEIGGGIGQIQAELVRRGAASGRVVDAVGRSTQDLAGELARSVGIADRSTFEVADPLAEPEAVDAADIVVLRRVVCCSPDGPELLAVGATKARRALLASYPRDRWLARIAAPAREHRARVMRKRFRAYLHAPGELERAAGRHGLTRTRVVRGLLWETAQFDTAASRRRVSSRTADESSGSPRSA